MSILGEINRLQSAKMTLSNWLESSGYAVNSASLLDYLCNQVSGIQLQKYRVGNTTPDNMVGDENDLYLEI